MSYHQSILSAVGRMKVLVLQGVQDGTPQHPLCHTKELVFYSHNKEKLLTCIRQGKWHDLMFVTKRSLQLGCEVEVGKNGCKEPIRKQLETSGPERMPMQ